MKWLALFGSWLLLVACQQRSQPVTPAFDAVVEQIGGDYTLPLLTFGDRTTDVAQLIGVPSASRFYYAINLPATYWKSGLALTTMIRRATTAEQVSCITMGPAYPAVVVVSAIGK